MQSSKRSPPRRIPRPTTAFFKGSIAGAPGSSVLLSVGKNGAVHGIAHRGNTSFILARSKGPTAGGPVAAAAAMAAAPLASRRTTSAQTKELPRFSCGSQRKAAAPGRPRAPAASAAGTRRLKQARVRGWAGSWVGWKLAKSKHRRACLSPACSCEAYSHTLSCSRAAAVGGRPAHPGQHRD